MQTTFIGVDVAKVELVISVGELAPASIKNNVGAISQWLCTLPQGCCIAMESTGRYHQQLAHLAHEAGFAVHVLNARDVYFYAKALGARAKSDAVDCVVIRRYVQEHQHSLHTWQHWHASAAAIAHSERWSRSFEQLNPVAKRDRWGHAACISANGSAAKYASSGVAWPCA